MGIRTKFCPMGSSSSFKDKGNLSLWRYSNTVISGKTLLYNYIGSWNTNLYAWDFNSYSTVLYTKSVAPSDYWGIFYYANGSQRPLDEFMGSLINDSALQIYSGGSTTVKLGVAYRNPVEDIQGTLPNGILYVPKAGGKAIINDWNSSTSSGTTDTNRNTPFCNNPNVKSVDFQGVPFRNNSMYNAFYNCHNLTSVKNIPNSVTDMWGTFGSCYNLNQNIQIPNSVTDMYGTFSHCYNLNQNIRIPSSVTNVRATFSGCHNLNQNIQIPSNVTSMFTTFSGCYNLNQNIQIPNSVTNMYMAFFNCYNLNQNIRIPSNVTDMTGTFNYCNRLNQNIKIPSSVTGMLSTFSNCTNLKCAYIHAANITDMRNCFTNTNNGNTHVVIPSRYIYNNATGTYYSLKDAGWTITNQGALVGPTGNKIHGWDIIQGDYPTYTANGTHYILQKWGGNLSANLNNNNPVLNVEVPKYYNTYDLFPTAFTAACFSANRTITSLDLGQSMLNGTSGRNAFRNMNSCLSITNINIPVGVTNIIAMFAHCNDATSISTGGRIPNTAYLVLPTGLTHLGSCLGYTINAGLKNYYAFGRDITNLQFGLAHVNNRNVNFFIEAANATAIGNFGNGVGTSYRKNIYIHFKYSNGEATKTFNLFKAVAYMGTSGNTSFANPSYNSTSNWYIYNINPASVFTYLDYNITNYNDASPMKCLALMPQYPDYSMPSWVGHNTFNGATTVQAIDYRNVRFYSSNLANAFAECRNLRSITNLNYSTSSTINWYRAFYNCRNLSVVERNGGNGFIDLGASTNVAGLFYGVQNLQSMPFTNFDSNNAIRINSQITNLSGTFSGCTKFNSNLVGLSDSVTDISYTFSNCHNLNQNIQIPNSVTSITHTFYACHNLNQNIRIPNSVTDISYAFSNCHNLNQNIRIPNSVTSMTHTFYDCFNLNQNIQIPNSVTNMFYTFYACRNLNQNIQIPNSVTNMAHTFDFCTGLNQNIQIPNSVTNMRSTFYDCFSLNQNIQIPNSVKSMDSTFEHCYNLNQNIQIPNSVTDMDLTFNNCNNLQGRINVLTTELTSSYRTFWNTNAYKPKEVYIYFNYANGVPTKTYNLVVASTDANYKWNGQNGVTIYNLGNAPW